MTRYIDADAIHYVEIGKGVEIALASDIDKTPTISPDEVRGFGKWIVLEPEIDLRSCSVCEHMVIRADCNYCPNCGAKMEVSEDG